MFALAASACASTSTSGGAPQEPHGQVIVDAVAALGVDPVRLRAKGYGAHCPLVESADEAYQDRRVETKVLRTKDGETGVELGCTSAAKAAL